MKRIGLLKIAGASAVLYAAGIVAVIVLSVNTGAFEPRKAAVLLPLTLRSCQPAISNVLVNAAVAPRVPQAQRATYLSLHSLAGRLGYSGVLFVLSRVASEASGMDFDTIGVMLRGCTWLAAAGLAALLVTRPMLRQDA